MPKKDGVTVCVFDLDGTLWKVNSHLDILNNYYKTNKYTSIFHRMFCKFFPTQYLRYINRKFEEIPDMFVEEYRPEFRSDGINLLIEMQDKYDVVVVISTAPERILNKVRDRLDIDVLRGEAYKKSITLRQYIDGEITRLGVVTDNLSDKDLIEISEEAIIYTTKKRRRKFTNYNLPKCIEFRDSKLK